MLFWTAITFAGALFLIGIALYFYQPRLVFHPARDFAMTPDQLHLPYEDVHINVTANERIHGWFFPADHCDPGATRPVVLFCHGNAGNISHRLETAEFLLDLGVDVLLFDYRGYGGSDGSPSESNAYADAEACYRWLTDEKSYDPKQIVIFGRSLGGAVAADLALRHPCRGLILESTLTSVADMAERVFPLPLVRHLVRYRFNTADKVGRVSCPILVTHSPADELVPYAMGRRLFDIAREPKHFLPLRGGHNEREYLDDAVYRETLCRFLQQPAGDREENEFE